MLIIACVVHRNLFLIYNMGVLLGNSGQMNVAAYTVYVLIEAQCASARAWVRVY